MSPLRKIAASVIWTNVTCRYKSFCPWSCHIFQIWYIFCIQHNKRLNKLVEKLYFLGHGAFTTQITAMLQVGMNFNHLELAHWAKQPALMENITFSTGRSQDSYVMILSVPAGKCLVWSLISSELDLLTYGMKQLKKKKQTHTNKFYIITSFVCLKVVYEWILCWG